MKGVVVLGATGSIGQSTLDVVARHPDRYRIIALSAHSQVERLQKLCLIHRPRFAVMSDVNAADRLRLLLVQEAPEIEVLAGSAALDEIVALPDVDIVMAAIVGAAGLLSALAAAKAGKRLLLANKEALVMSGQLFMEAVNANGAELLPIDSEHNAVFQCLPPGFDGKPVNYGIERIILTASGGPFRDYPIEELEAVTPDAATAHPNWSMGPKISVDSATMMNKGLEVIEACWLFGAEPDQVDVVIHPQSIIHSMVQYSDGSTLAQLGNPDMRTPIANALAWPERIASGVANLDVANLTALNFSRPEPMRFPCLARAYQALRTGGTAPTNLNAANEVAVAAFLEQQLSFTAISAVVEQTLAQCAVQPADSVEAILDADRSAREQASKIVAGRGPR